MEERYFPEKIEQAARDYWEERNSFMAMEDPGREKFYCLSMFPYPSGKLHMGHVRNYTIGDVIARYQRMQGKNVLQPMGWDAFGLPAENAAMANHQPPAAWTHANIAYMKQQLKSLGFAIDWRREVATCTPEYYKWNQWMFLRMLEKGIAYKTTGVVNWDPVDRTVLANEQVIDGRGWRTGAPVEKREIPMYYLRITDYAEELLADLDKLPEWPERVKAMQANWIGKSVGVRFAFPYKLDGEEGKLWVFTTRADTIMGVTFCAVAAEHPLAIHAAQSNPKLAAFIEECQRGSVMEADLATIEKKGMPTGISVTHPLTGEPIPLWVGNYVLMAYGEGAVMAVPAHDERDFYFAKQYGLPIKQVIESEALEAVDIRLVQAEGSQAADTSSMHNYISEYGDPHGAGAEYWEQLLREATEYNPSEWKEWYADKERSRCVNSGKYDGLGHAAAVEAIAADLKAKGLGDTQVMWRLRDWGISRQRYWGCPIPIIHCDRCGDVPVPDADLPVVLPEDCVPDGSGNPLDKRPDFVDTTCPKCGAAAKRETDTMDTFVDSSWYYARYCSPDNPAAMVDERVQYWMPVDQYIGGIEHAILHLLYSRFWWKVMRDVQGSTNAGRSQHPASRDTGTSLYGAGGATAGMQEVEQRRERLPRMPGAADPGRIITYDEPFTRLLTQGMVLNEIFFRRPESGRLTYYNPADVEIKYDDKGQRSGAILKSDGQPVESGGLGTMSKSKNNGVDPQSLIEQYGADTARLFMMFAAPPEMTLEWSDSAVEGAFRFLKRLWSFAYQHRGLVRELPPPAVDWSSAPGEYRGMRREIHLALRQANHDFRKFQFNTVVSAAMKMLNALEGMPPAAKVAAGGSHQPVYPAVVAEGLSLLLRLLSPVIPHITHTLWKELRYGDDILQASWPEHDPTALVQDQIEIVVQVNGRLRSRVSVPADALEDRVRDIALADENVQRHIGSKAVKKVIVVPGKLVNFVVAG